MMQVVDLTGLMQVANKLYQGLLTSSSYIKSVNSRLDCNLIFADLLQVDETTCIKPACSSQLAASLLTTCNRLVIIKAEQAMQTHPDIGWVIADMLQFARFYYNRGRFGGGNLWKGLRVGESDMNIIAPCKQIELQVMYPILFS